MRVRTFHAIQLLHGVREIDKRHLKTILKVHIKTKFIMLKKIKIIKPLEIFSFLINFFPYFKFTIFISYNFYKNTKSENKIKIASCISKMIFLTSKD